MSNQFQRVAEAVTQRIGDLLGAQVTVLDSQGRVAASSQPGQCLDRDVALPLCLPLQLDGQTGEVLVAEPADGERLSPRLVQALVDLMVNQATVVARLPNQHELKSKFIHDLLHGTQRDEAELLREGQILGMDFSRPRAVILIDAANFLASVGTWSGAEPRRAQLVISSVVSFFQLPNDTICAYIGGGEIAVLKASSSRDLEAWTEREDGSSALNPSWSDLTALKRAGAALLTRLRSDTQASISIGIGRYHPRLTGLTHSYQDARAALSLGRRVHGQNQVHCLDSLGVAAFIGLSDESTKVDLARHLLSPLDQEPELLTTLDAFFRENCWPSSTAGRLSIHRNTLSYRLEKITSLTGLDPRRFDDGVQIRLALLLRALQAESAHLMGKCPTASVPSPQSLRQTPNVTSG
ncbi:CdaR family transcriptional regulator [Leptolyngbya sp. FACHB-261]|uniref:PucR family transcriptional regulator n=1 Tax=Leptolyngbya sp. FACHB-261 TaxID=2692806 RepID=UPI00168936C3|nr:helix-turn-helix domain-containing protein [Leptolyngbya sp. FACHB-261]MBD2101975.1 helix-turn-helix domain-containing protein [Leptolyngbya sp. FACHB-261]